MAFISSTLPRILLDAGLKSLLLLAAVWLVARLLHKSSAAARHRAWSLGLCGLLVLPVLSAVVPHWRISVFAPAGSQPTSVARVSKPESVEAPVVEQTNDPGELNTPGIGREVVEPVMPPAQQEVPRETEPAPSTIGSDKTPGAVTPRTIDRASTTNILAASFVGLWLAGALAALATLAYGLYTVGRICARSRPFEDAAWRELIRQCAKLLGTSDKVRLLQSPTAIVPFAWGLWRPSVVLPNDAADWPPDRRRAVLLHELAHIQRHDVLIQLLGRLACALYWFNPLAWYALRQLRYERELACDDCVLASGEVATTYAGELIAIARAYRMTNLSSAVGMATRPQLETRIQAILDSSRPRSPLGRRLATGLFLGAALLVVFFAAIELGPRAAAVANAEEPRTTEPKPPEAQAQAPKEKEPAPGAKPAPKTFADDQVEVSGAVVDEQDMPVANVKVTPLTVLPSTAGVTDAKGAFSVGLPEEDASSPTLLASNADGTRQGIVNLPTRDRLAALVEKAPPEKVRIVLKAPRELAVEVADSTGEPVLRAVVSANAWYRCLPETQTDAAGRAVLRVPTDAVLDSVTANKDDVGLDYAVFQKVDDRERDTNRLAADFAGPIKFVLDGVRPMRIRLLDGKREPVAGVVVRPSGVFIANKGGDVMLTDYPRFNVATDKNGVADFRSIPKANKTIVQFFVLSKTHPPQGEMFFHPASKDEELTVTVLPTVPISGRVVIADGTPAGITQIMAIGQGFQYDIFRRITRTDAQGRFSLRAYPNQVLTIQATAGKLCSTLDAFGILEKAPAREIKLTLKEGTRVFGRMTTGADRKPLPEQQVSLMQSGATDSSTLPAAEQLPRPSSAPPRQFRVPIPRSARTDKEGRFEIWVPPGAHDIMGQNLVRSQIKIKDEKEIEVNLDTVKPAEVETTGRVVLKEDPSKPVAGVRLRGNSLTSGGRFEAVTDSEGRFRTRRVTNEMVVYAESKDRSLGAIVKLGAEESKVEIQVSPTITASGRLLGGGKPDKPLAGRQIEWGIRTDSEDGPGRITAITSDDRVKTDENGKFSIPGLIPGSKYAVFLLGEELPVASSRREIAAITPEVGKRGIDLGDILVKFPSVSQGMESRIEKTFAGVGAPAEQMKTALLDARLADKNLLVLLTSPNQPACIDFHTFQYDLLDREQREAARKALANYAVLGIDTTDKTLSDAWKKELAGRKIGWPVEDETLFAVVNAKGELVATAPAKDLSADGKLASDKLVEFLTRYAPEMPDDAKTFDDALAMAKKDDKRVLVQFTGLKMSRYLDANRGLFAKDYVHVQLHPRHANNKEALAKIRKKPEESPWFAILDADGKTLITSEGPDGNIGYPGTPAGKKRFEKMLRDTAKRLTAEEISKLIEAIDK